MAGKKKEEKQRYEKEEAKTMQLPEGMPLPPQIPPELKEKLDKIKQKLEKFSKEVVSKFEKYIVGVALLPPPNVHPGMTPEELAKAQQENKDKIHALVLIDDSEPSKISKFELKEKISDIVDKTAKEIDPNITPQIVLLGELWQNCYDGKYEVMQLIALSAPVYDTGMLSAIKIAELHKSMVLKKFEKYIVAYILAGSLVQGKATKDSDIDVFIVIDDTDVKKMTRVELKDKLRQIIISMGFQAGEITGIRNKLNVQVYILTDFWESVKEAHPVIFTFLRDGVPFFDRGIFMPWKQLLKMGRIRPSPEAIDMYMSSGEQIIDRIKFKIRDIGMEDLFYSILTPSQAALMMWGFPPPTPKETPEVMRDIFVKKEKLLSEDDIKMLEHNIQVRKEIEHGTKKELSGKEMDELLENAQKYLKRIRKLFTQIEKIKEEETLLNVYDTVTTIMRDILVRENVEKVVEADLLHEFENKLVSTGKIPAKYLRQIHAVFDTKKHYDAGKLTKTEVEKARKEAGELIRFLVEYLQRERGKELARTKIKVKHGEKYGEVTILDNQAFIIRDVDAEEKEIEKALVEKDGSIGVASKSSYQEFEQSLAKVKIPSKVFIKEPVFESLKKIFGKDVEVLVHV